MLTNGARAGLFPIHLTVMQGLQQKNLELLTVVRTLGAEKENERAAVEAAKEEVKKHVEEELSAIQAENDRVQVSHHSLNQLAVRPLLRLDSHPQIAIHVHVKPLIAV